MDDIIIVMPWTDDDQWFKRSYWYYPATKTYSVDEYSDGDHEDVDEDDLPNYLEVEEAWLEYYKHVAQTGEDPIEEFIVKRVRKVKEVWFVSFAQSIVGIGINRIKHAGRYYAAHEVPKHVKDYFWIVETPNFLQLKMDPEALTWETLTEVVGGDPHRKLYRFEIENQIPVSPDKVRRQLLKRARKAVKDKTASLKRTASI